MTSNVLENLSTKVRKSSQNTSKIDLEGGLEAALEPPLCGGDPKTLFLAILAPLWDPIWGPVLALFGDRFLIIFYLSSGWQIWWFGVHLGPILGAFWGTFLEACLNLYVNRDRHENKTIYYGLAMSEPLENLLFGTHWDHFGMLFRVCILGGLQDHILTILALFWGVFWRPFWSLLGYHFCIDFQRISGILQRSK